MPDKIINRPSTQISRSLSRPAAADLIAGSQQREHVRMRTYIYKNNFYLFCARTRIKSPEPQAATAAVHNRGQVCCKK
jgi:hypothetical protein